VHVLKSINLVVVLYWNVYPWEQLLQALKKTYPRLEQFAIKVQLVTGDPLLAYPGAQARH
jgi:hypothetical protein